MSYLGDFYLGANIDTKFTTVNTSGVPTMLTGSPAVVAYPDNSTTELTAGISLTTNFDGRSGLNHVRVQATGANGYATGTNYSLVLASGTVGGNFVGGYAVREFSIEARAALRPAQDGRDVALSPDGLVDVNDKTGFSLSNPQTFNLNGYVGTVTGSVQSVTNPVTVGTNNDKTSYSLSSPQTFDLIGNITGTFVGNISGAVGQLQTNLDKLGYGLLNNQVINISGTITNVHNVLNPVTVGTNNDKTGYGLATGTLLEAIADVVWDEQLGGHQITGSAGRRLNDAASAGSDPWLTTLPGSYTVGQAGYIVGTNLDARVSSRMASGTVVVGDKTGFSLSSPQNFNLIGNISGTFVGNIRGSVGNVTGTVNSNLIQIDGLATNGNNATLRLKKLDIVNNDLSGVAVNVQADTNPAFIINSNNSDGLFIAGGTNGVNITGNDNDGITVYGLQNGVTLAGDGTYPGLNVISYGTGKSINAPQGIQGDLIGNITGTLIGNIYGNVTGTSGIRTGTFIEAIADQVWDEQIGGHLITGSTGRKLSDAASAGDPWGTALPGIYAPGQAGFILGTNLNDTVSSRMPSGTIPTASQIATETLNQASSNPIDSNVKQVNDVTLQGDGSTTPWGPV